MRARINGKFYPISDLQIETYLVGDLTSKGALTIESAMKENEALRRHIAERLLEQKAFYFQNPILRPESTAKIHSDFTMPWKWIGFGAAVSFALLIFWLFPLRLLPPYQSPSTDIRTMGSFKIELTLKRGDELRRVEPDDTLHKGDRIRITVESPETGYLTVLGKDDSDHIFVYYDAVWKPAGTFTLPDSLILDDYQGEEQWLIILSLQKNPAGAYISTWQNEEPFDASIVLVPINKE